MVGSINVDVDLVVVDFSLRTQLEEFLASDGEFRVMESDNTGVPDLLILELDETDSSKTFSYINELHQTAPDTEIFLTGVQIDTELLLEVLHAGVREFFPRPLRRDQLERALAQFKIRYKERHQQSSRPLGKIISVIGGKGGVGTTTVAVNLAVSLKRVASHKKIALMDVNLEAGEVHLFLDMKGEHGLSAVVRDLTRLDTTFLQSLLSTHSSGVSLLPVGEGDLSAETLPRDCTGETADLLCSLFDYLIVDCGSGLTPANSSVVERSFSILVVATVSAPAIRRTRGLMESFQGLHIPEDKVKLLINRYSPSASAPLKETEEFLQRKASWLLPNDYDLVGKSINEGIPLASLAPSAKVTKSFLKLARLSLHDDNEQEKIPSSFLAKFFKAKK